MIIIAVQINGRKYKPQIVLKEYDITVRAIDEGNEEYNRQFND